MRGHQGRQGHWPHDDDEEEEEDNEVEENDKDNDNNKDDKNDKGISSLGPPQKAHCATTKIQISKLWDFIETRDFFEDDLEKSDWKWALKKYFTDRSRIMNHTFLFSCNSSYIHSFVTDSLSHVWISAHSPILNDIFHLISLNQLIRLS